MHSRSLDRLSHQWSWTEAVSITCSKSSVLRAKPSCPVDNMSVCPVCMYSVVSSAWCLSVLCWQTHDNLEHLAIMERVLGPVPASMIRETKYDFSVVYCHLSWRSAVHLSVSCVCLKVITKLALLVWHQEWLWYVKCCSGILQWIYWWFFDTSAKHRWTCEIIFEVVIYLFVW